MRTYSGSKDKARQISQGCLGRAGQTSTQVGCLLDRAKHATIFQGIKSCWIIYCEHWVEVWPLRNNLGGLDFGGLQIDV